MMLDLFFSKKNTYTRKKNILNIADALLSNMNSFTCSANASRHCRPSGFWVRLLNLDKKCTWEEQEKCEQSFMSSCMDEGKKHCSSHAEEFCNRSFIGSTVSEIERGSDST